MPERPQSDEYTPFQAAYIALVPETDILAVLRGQIDTLGQVIADISPEKEHFRYAPDKWSVRQVFGHLGDAERIFGYRALCLAREGRETLPPFDENLFVETAGFDERTLSDLAEELLLLRRANLSMLYALQPAAWAHVGLVNDARTSTQAVAWVMAGHARHHLAILKGRYNGGDA